MSTPKITASAQLILLTLSHAAAEMDNTTLAAATNISPFTLIKNLRPLVAANLVNRRKEGKRILYSTPAIAAVPQS